MAEFFSPKGNRVGVESEKDKFSIPLAIRRRRISAEVISPSCSRRGVSVLAGLTKWLEKPPDLLAMQTHEPNTQVVPVSIAAKLNSKETIEFFC